MRRRTRRFRIGVDGSGTKEGKGGAKTSGGARSDEPLKRHLAAHKCQRRHAPLVLVVPAAAAIPASLELHAARAAPIPQTLIICGAIQAIALLYGVIQAISLLCGVMHAVSSRITGRAVHNWRPLLSTRVPRSYCPLHRKATEVLPPGVRQVSAR